MQPIEDYRIVRSNDLIAFQEKVTEYLKQGYELYGNPYAHGEDQCQAIVKFKSADKERSGF
jgi:hypothetical protein